MIKKLEKAADAEMIKWAKIALSDDAEHDGDPETETYKIKLDGSARFLMMIQ